MSEMTALKDALPKFESEAEDETNYLPNNIDAEQIIIGSLLFNNEIYDHISSIINSEHFFLPTHKVLFSTICSHIEKNKLATPITISILLGDNEEFQELGGQGYLIKLAQAVSSPMAAQDYAQMIYDLALRRGLIVIGSSISDRARSITVDSNPTEDIAIAEQELYLLSEQGQVSKGFQSFVISVTDAVKQVSAAYKRDGSLAGISTGLKDLDEILGGLQKSDLLILAGRPSMGKTALATNIAFHVAKSYKKGTNDDGEEGAVNGGVVGFFSLEMSSEQLAGRILSEATEIESYRLRSGRINESEFRRLIEAAKHLETCPLFIDDTPALPINQLATRARRLKRTHGLDVLVVDYLQLVRPSRDKENRVNEISDITQGLKAIAKELDIPVVALSQLSRQVEQRDDNKPQLADLRESGSIEQDADVVMFVYRAEYYLERKKPTEHDSEKMAQWQSDMEAVHNIAEIIIGKQRHGPIGTVNLQFSPQFTKFNNLAEGDAPDSSAGYKSTSTKTTSKSKSTPADDATDF